MVPSFIAQSGLQVRAIINTPISEIGKNKHCLLSMSLCWGRSQRKDSAQYFARSGLFLQHQALPVRMKDFIFNTCPYCHSTFPPLIFIFLDPSQDHSEKNSQTQKVKQPSSQAPSHHRT